MQLSSYKSSFDTLMGVKNAPNEHELDLYDRVKKYIGKLRWIPGIKMIAVVNSLSMFATHKDSDIDLFIVTAKNRMWLVRFLVTGIFWMHGVWRKNDDIAGNFCLSFWIEESAMDMSSIAIENDVYLFFWMYYMKPVFIRGDAWEVFVKKNHHFEFSPKYKEFCYYQEKDQSNGKCITKVLTGLNSFFRFFGERKSMNSWHNLGNPPGVIIREDMLKFHVKDKRNEIREKILDNS